MPNPAFIVEGRMEQLIAAKICPGQPIKKIGCNGDEAPIAVMAKFVSAQIKILNNKYYPIVIVFDRENRQSTCEQIRLEMINILQNDYGYADQDIRIFVCDRMTEDLYLADIDTIVNHYKLPPYADQNFSGKGGLARLLEPKIRYHETTYGVEIFFLIDHKKVAQKLSHWSKFLETVEELVCAGFPHKLV
jgi:hypothetical protein